MRRHRQLTVSPRDTVLDLRLEEAFLTDTEVVLLAVPSGLPGPPEAGTAMRVAASTAMMVICSEALHGDHRG